MSSARTGYVVAIVAVVLAAITLIALVEYGGDDGAAELAPTDSLPTDLVVPTRATATLDELGCTYEGDLTPKAPAFMMNVVNLSTGWAVVEVDRIPADITNDEVEEFFEDAEETLRQGGGFRGVPADWP